MEAWQLREKVYDIFTVQGVDFADGIPLLPDFDPELAAGDPFDEAMFFDRAQRVATQLSVQKLPEDSPLRQVMTPERAMNVLNGPKEQRRIV